MEEEVGGADKRRRAALVPSGEVQGDQRAPLDRPGGAGWRPTRTGKSGPSLAGLPVAPHGPAQGDGLGELVGERRREAEDTPASADEVEARDVTGEHGGMAPVRREAEPGAQQEPGDQRREAGCEDDGVAQGPRAQEHGVGTLGLGPSGLRPQPGPVVRLEEPSFHGEAG